MYDFEQYALLCGAFFTCFLKKQMIENKKPQLLFVENKKNTLRTLRESVLVPKIGVEPIRCFHRGILSPLRLPIPPFRHIKD